MNAHPVNSKGFMRIFALNNQEDAATPKRELMYTEPDLRTGLFIRFIAPDKAVGAASHPRYCELILFHITLTSGGPGREGSLWTCYSFVLLSFLL